MRAGQLRQRISIQTPNETQDDAGAITTTWTELVETWAAVEPSTGTERWVEGMDQRVAERLTRVRVRFRDDVEIDERCRVVFGEQVLNIERIVNRWSRDRELVMLCSEVNPEEL